MEPNEIKEEVTQEETTEEPKEEYNIPGSVCQPDDDEDEEGDPMCEAMKDDINDVFGDEDDDWDVTPLMIMNTLEDIRTFLSEISMIERRNSITLQKILIATKKGSKAEVNVKIKGDKGEVKTKKKKK